MNGEKAYNQFSKVTSACNNTFGSLEVSLEPKVSLETKVKVFAYKQPFDDWKRVSWLKKDPS